MLRTILTPTNNTLTIQLPDDLVGKVVEVIAFEIDQRDTPLAEFDSNDKATRLEQLINGLAPYRTSLKNFKFDRDFN